MKHLNALSAGILTFAVIIAGTNVHAHCGACGSDSHSATKNASVNASEEMAAMKKSIVETAVSAGEFNTLVTAVKAAGLVETLSGEGPFTVFAPTDAAFAELPKGTIDALLKDKAKLTSILTYHVVPGNVTASDVVKLTSAETVNGEPVTISANGKGVMVGGAKVVTTDIMCSNGIIHVIDAVMMPGQNDLIQTAMNAGSFKTLLSALEAADLTDALRGKGPFTVFAPTEEAFAALPPGTLESLLADPDALAQILLYHVVAGEVTAAEVVNLTEATTLNGAPVDIIVNGGVMINDANVIQTDIFAKNGVVHLIDQVLIPPTP